MRMFKHKKTSHYAESQSGVDGYYVYINATHSLGLYPKWLIEDSNDWEEIKDPLFVTEDGIEILQDEKIIFYVYKNPYLVQIGVTTLRSVIHENDKFIFSTKEAAEKWIDENKPVFSRKRLRDLIQHKSWLDSKEMEEFKQKLGL